jgi:hypothetical protein
VVNNYYDQPSGQEHHAEHGGFDQGGQEQHFRESADQGGAQLSDASYDTRGDDQGSNDDAGYGGDDNVAQDDGSGFDDGGGGGGFDDGGGGGGGDFS